MIQMAREGNMIIAVAKPVLSFAACAFILTFFPLRYNPHGWEFVLMVAAAGGLLTLTVEWSRALARRLRHHPNA